MKKHMTDLNKLSTAELHTMLIALKEEIVELRRGVILGDMQNNQLATQKRRQVARIKMLLANPETKVEVKEEEVAATKKVAKKTTAKEKK